jgi:hypothetical protein
VQKTSSTQSNARREKLINLFICGLFNDAASSSDYSASNNRIISEISIGKHMEGSGNALI